MVVRWGAEDKLARNEERGIVHNMAPSDIRRERDGNESTGCLRRLVAVGSSAGGRQEVAVTKAERKYRHELESRRRKISIVRHPLLTLR